VTPNVSRTIQSFPLGIEHSSGTKFAELQMNENEIENWRASFPCVAIGTPAFLATGLIMFSKQKQLLVGVMVTLVSWSESALAAAPAGQAVNSSSISLAQYMGGGVLGDGAIDDPSKLYWVDKTIGTIHSFLVFFDPKNASLTGAVLDFGKPIGSAVSTKYQDPSFNCRYKASTDLEDLDYHSYTAGKGSVDSIRRGNRSEDTVHVLTAASEPTTYMMFGVGLVVVGMMARRRMKVWS
jgi:hypothetical protein